jgi:RNA polymerase sigma factor (sigma-70 family)
MSIDFLTTHSGYNRDSVTEDFDERRLVEQVIAGHPGSAGVFVDRCGPVVVRVLRGLRISHEDRDDCWQDVFLKFFENDCARLKAWHGSRRGGSLRSCSLKGYIAVSAKRIAVDLLRSRMFVRDGHTAKREVPLEPEFDRAGESESRDDSMGLQPEVIREVARKCLTPRHFELYERYCRGESPKAIGQASNMETDHVYVEKHRMVGALRECLRKRGLWPL